MQKYGKTLTYDRIFPIFCIESFEETPTGLKGYVQQQLFDQEALQTALAEFPFDNVNITYTIREAEDRDWNEQWEQEGFEPIIVRGKWREVRGKRNVQALIIHDGRHLPTEEISHLSPLTSHLIEIEIDAKLAFGTGTHETTRMICATLFDSKSLGLRHGHRHPLHLCPETWCQGGHRLRHRRMVGGQCPS